MELDRLFGLPAHPLLVHLPVVLVPMAALMAVAMAVRPVWLDRFGWWLVAVSGVGFVGAALAAGSGEALEERVDPSAALDRHAQLGETARLVAFVFFVLATVVVGVRWWARRRAAPEATGLPAFDRSKAGAIVAAVVLVVSAAAAMYTMVEVGHQGAKVTWNNIGSEGDGGG